MFVDLSVLVSEQTPVYPGDPPVKIAKVNNFEQANFVDHMLTFGTHVGTHVDAPMHMLQGGASLASATIDRFIGAGKLIDVRNNNFAAVKDVNIQAGDIVLFYTGMSERYDGPSYFYNYPAMPEEIATYLTERQVKMVGIDTCSIDNVKHFPIHKILLSHGIFIIENLVNLKSLLGKSYKVFCMPLKLDLDGAPARVIAEIQ